MRNQHFCVNQHLGINPKSAFLTHCSSFFTIFAKRMKHMEKRDFSQSLECAAPKWGSNIQHITLREKYVWVSNINGIDFLICYCGTIQKFGEKYPALSGLQIPNICKTPHPIIMYSRLDYKSWISFVSFLLGWACYLWCSKKFQSERKVHILNSLGSTWWVTKSQKIVLMQKQMILTSAWRA